VTDTDAACDMLEPYDARRMRCYPVSSRVNHVANDDEGCSTPVKLVESQKILFSC
jgi:putative SOS response-associated peptidase YedK